MKGSAAERAAVRLGLLVPARDEAGTIEAKLANLASLAWPAPGAGRPHVVVIVDDHSADGTGQRAVEAVGVAALRASGVVCIARASDEPAGKPGAIRAGLRALREHGFEGATDLVVLTDADVSLEARALHALSEAFAREPRLGMACGVQRYVRANDERAREDPSPAGPRSLASDAGLYDRLFAAARSLESCLGALLSVHGQLLAWRASLDLAPPDGRAADDLELVVAARDRSPAPRVRAVAAARFFEQRAAEGAPRAAQALRRARAWFQHFDGPRPRRRALRAQWLAWRAAPALFLALTLPLSPLSRSLAARRRQLSDARREERARPQSARWEVARG